MRVLIKCFSLSIFLLTTGCVNNFTQNYKSLPTPLGLSQIHDDHEVEIISTKNLDKDIRKYQQQGFLPIGRSEFYANRYQDKSDIKKQAEVIGAQLVLVLREDLGSSTYSMPVTTPTMEYSTSNSNYNVYNNTNTNIGRIQGQSNTISHGSKTNYIPVTVNHGKYTAFFLAKFKTSTGIIPRELSDTDRQLLGQNSGIIVDTIVNASPAYYQNIIENDVVLKINGKSIFGVNGFIGLINDNLSNGKLRLDILRQGKILKKEIILSK